MIRSETHNKNSSLVDQLPEEQRECGGFKALCRYEFQRNQPMTRVSINTALGRMRYALINIRKMMEEQAMVLQ